MKSINSSVRFCRKPALVVAPRRVVESGPAGAQHEEAAYARPPFSARRS